LSEEEFANFERLMREQTRRRLQRQEVDDWLRLSEHLLNQLSADVDDREDLISHC